MVLENKLNITNQLELNKAEEKISKQKAKQLFDFANDQFLQQLANHLPLREWNHFYRPQFIFPGPLNDSFAQPANGALQRGLYTFL